MDKYIGRLLDNRYEILDVIGTGGMAVVYKARCHRLNRLVAIKILKDDYLEDEEFRRRFHSESQAVAMLSHPNIVSVYDVSSSITADYIVMELIDGITLKQYMEKKGVLNWKETLHFAIQFGKALGHAHSRGIVHRDIKPHNVMVLKNGSVKVTDFGIARMMSKGNTLTKEALGSVHYISPQQAKGGRVDNRSDIYSLGVVMYEMMSGRPPYDGESPVAVAIQHINGGAVMPSTLNPNIPGGLEQIIMKAMAQEATDRYGTAAQMLTDMDEFRKNPAILFDYNTPPTDEVTKLPKPPLVLEQEPPKTTAERVERSKTDISQLPQRRKAANEAKAAGKKSPRKKAEESRSNAGTIAIIACSAVMVIAIVIFLVVLFSDGTGGKTELVDVPQLVGQTYIDLPQYTDFNVKVENEVHDNTYPAGQIIKQEPAGNTQIQKGKTVYVTVSLGKAPNTDMPSLVKWELSEAERALNNLSLNLHIVVEEEFNETVTKGSVIRTEPMAQAKLTAGQTVKLFVSKGVEVQIGAMPDVVGDKLESAQKVLQSQNLELDVVVEEIFDSTVPAGDVIRTEPERNQELKTGQTVTLFVSKGAQLAEIKKLSGLSVDAAVAILKGDGFTNYQIETVESDKQQDTIIELRSGDKVLTPGDKVDVKAEITLVVSKGPNSTPQVKQNVTINLREYTETGDCLITILRDGEEVYKGTVAQGVKTVTIPNQVGSGTVYYEVVVGEYVESWIEKVTF